MKKRILPIGLCCLSVLGLQAQGSFKTTAGAYVKASGSARIVLKNAHWNNSGTFTPGGSTVAFTGTQVAGCEVAGAAADAFSGLTVNRSAGAVSLQKDLTVNGDLTFTAGNLDLNGNDLVLGQPGGILVSEGETKRIFSSSNGEVQLTTTLDAPNSANPGNLGFVITSTADLGASTIRRGHQAFTGPCNVAIKRYYVVQPANNTGLNATLRFYYFDAELNGLTEANLSLFRSDDGGTTWTHVGFSSRNTTENWMEKTGVASLSLWTLADVNWQYTTYYADADGDTYGDPAVTTQACTQPSGYVANNTDCDDADPLEYPGQTWYIDADADDYGASSVAQCLRPANGFVLAELAPGSTGTDDCDDAIPAIHPGATETCNGLDDDCDGLTDEGFATTWYADADGDTYGDPSVSTQACSAPSGYVANNTDCDDADPLEHPGQTWYIDADADDYGASSVVQCLRPANGFVLAELAPGSTGTDDCVDADPLEHPGQTWYIDADADDYGSSSTVQCLRPANGFVLAELAPGSTGTDDCDDADPDIHPGATETCNSLDDDCDGEVDEGLSTTYFADADGDGFGNPAVFTYTCTAPPNYVTNSDDCDDNDPAVKGEVTEIVKDIAENDPSPGLNPEFLTDMNGILFFRANDGTNGTELWKSDGTIAGTVMVKDIRAGAGSSSPSNLTNVNGTLFFSTTDGTNGLELWKSDGTISGTVMVKDIRAGAGSSSPSNLTNVNGTLFFSANDGTNGAELWKSDGTTTGTVLVKDIIPGITSSNPYYLANVNSTLFFVALGDNVGTELWKSDGTAAGTVMVKDIMAGSGDSSPQFLTNINGTLFFTAIDMNGAELWKSDGTTAGTLLVKDIWVGSSSSSPQFLTNINGTLFFTANDGMNGAELWKSDGTAAGTVMVKDIQTGSGSSSPNHLTNVNGTLFFQAFDVANGYELWKSDGTAAGTVLVKDIYAGSSSPEKLTNVNGTLFFRAIDGTNGQELWKSDGTAAGTVLVKDIWVGTNSSSPSNLTSVNGTLFFSAHDGTNGNELWKSDGTATGTTIVFNRYAPISSVPNYLTNVNGTLFFSATNGTNGHELWKSDGAAAGTVLVKDIRAGGSGSAPYNLTSVNGTLLFSADDGTNGYELWKSDGTAAGTVLVKDIWIGSSGSSNQYLTNVNGTLFFSANDGTNGTELWKSDGTAAGTVMVKDIWAGAVGSSPQFLTNVNSTLFFSANDGTNGYELWKSDGTAAGTVLVKNIAFSTNGSFPENLTNVNGTLFFQANDGTNDQELWKSDGTTAGTVLVKDIFAGNSSSPSNLTNVNGTLFFSANDGTNGRELWKSDGTAAGTVMVKDIWAGGGYSSPANLTNVNGTLFFQANDGINGEELWKSDGTAAGTVMVKDIRAGTNSSSPANLTNVNGTLFFQANDGTNGQELWKSDGTAAGTVLVKDIYIGANSSSPANLTNVNGMVYFAANDGIHGTELWKTAPCQLRCASKAFLQGPYSGGTMSDALRSASLLPTVEPYANLGFTHVGGGGSERANAAVYNVTGNNAIVDWVFLQLRDKNNSATVLATRSALLQRDGDIVDVDGVSPVQFKGLSPDNYFVSVRHRNHLGVMGASTFGLFPTEPTSVDFSTIPTYGTNAQKNLGSGVMGLWAGNANVDGNVKYNGGSNDRVKVLTKVGFATPNNIVSGYHTEDVNMDGLVKYNGGSNDRVVILLNVGIATPNYILMQQLP